MLCRGVIAITLILSASSILNRLFTMAMFVHYLLNGEGRLVYNAPAPSLRLLNKIFLVLSCLALTSGCNTEHNTTNDDAARVIFTPPANRVSFDEIFRNVGNTHLSEDVLIGQIRYLDVNSQGDLLVTDFYASEVYLFDKTGAYLNTLDAEPCHPGFVMRPSKTFFVPKTEHIFMMNAGPWGYVFRPDGTCWKAVADSYRSVTEYCYDSTGKNFFGYTSSAGLGPGKGQITQMGLDGDVTHRFSVTHPFPNLAYRLTSGGFVCGSDGLLYHNDSYSPEMNAYTIEGELIKKVDIRSTSYAPLQSDIKNLSDPVAGIRNLAKVLKGHVLVHSVFPLGDDAFLVQYYERMDRGRNYSANIIDMNGEKYFQEDVSMESLFANVKQNRPYHIVQPDITEDGIVPNPYIVVYDIMFDVLFQKKGNGNDE